MRHSTVRRRNRPAKINKSRSPDASTDRREQLVNDGAIGAIEAVSLPVAIITSLLGILLDIDPRLFLDEVADKKLRCNPRRFYREIILPMLRRHPVLAKAQVLISGSGLHVVLRLREPVMFETEQQRQLWSVIVKIIQRVMPTDPEAPGITAMTRPVGSINGKNNKRVTEITRGELVTAEEVTSLFNEMREAPVRTVMKIVLGSERVEPCPICRGKGTALAALDRSAKCYGGHGGCGSVKLSQIYDIFIGRHRRKG